MAPLPENNTGCYFVDYVVAPGQAHTLLCRFNSPAGVDAVKAQVEDVLNALLPARPATWVVTGARIRSAGSNVTLPSVPPVITPGTAGVLDAPNYPRFCSFVGRGIASGRRIRLYIYGLIVASSGDYRYQPGEISGLDNARTELINATPNTFISIFGDAVSWQPYANVGYNSYFERKARG